MMTEAEAVAMIDPRNLDTLLHPQFDAKALKAATPLGKGLGASPGAACGKVVFTAEDAEEWGARGEKVVLVRLETSPEDIDRYEGCSGYPDCPRWYDQPRCSCCPRYGYLLCIRLWRYQHG